LIGQRVRNARKAMFFAAGSRFRPRWRGRTYERTALLGAARPTRPPILTHRPGDVEADLVLDLQLSNRIAQSLQPPKIAHINSR
jgi:hypothetical protein